MRWLTLAASLLVAALLAGCGAEDISPETLAQAAGKTQGAGTSRIAIKGAVRSPAAPSAVSVEGQGVLDSAAKRGKFDLEVPNPTGGGLGGDKIEFDQVIDGFVLYMRSPAFDSLLEAKDKEWLKIDLQRASRALGIDLGQVSQSGGSDPSESLRYLRASGQVEKVGEETVRGASTTHYRARVDIGKYPKLLPAGERSRAEATAKRLIELNGSSTIPTEVWIDDRGLVRRQRIVTAFPTPQGRAKMTQDIELYDFGVEVDVDVPPEDEVLDVTKLGAQAARQLQRP